MSRLKPSTGRSVGALLGVVLTALVTACAPRGATSLASTNGGARATAQDTTTTCAACSDFYTYANRSWLDTAAIPATMSDWGAFSANSAGVTASLHAILQDATSASVAPGSREAMLGGYYASCMDSTRAERDGLAPLHATLTRIAAITDRADIVRALATLRRAGVPVAFSFSSDVDRVGARRYIAMVEQGGMGLPVDTYLSTTPPAVTRRKAYATHVEHVFMLAGASASEAARDAGYVLAMETGLARGSLTRLQLVQATLSDFYREVSFSALMASAPDFPWADYLRTLEAPTPDTVIAPAPDFVAGVDRLLRERSVAEWRAYFRWRVLSDASPFLSRSFVEEHYRWASGATGTAVIPPRAERCVTATSDGLPELLGRSYAERSLSPASKARMNDMVEQIRAVLIERLATVPWLSAESRPVALEKAQRFGVKIGYPDSWHDYSALKLEPGAFVTMRAAALEFETDRLIQRIGQVPNPAEWDYHGQYRFVPQSPTAWANWDEIIFPAGYLHPPLFDSTADLATNLGGIGVVIAHEMTHLFTAGGGDIDQAGRIRRWWTTGDSTQFAAVAVRAVSQYNGYSLLDSATHVNGSLTLDENLADIGGVELAYAALVRTLEQRRAAGSGSDLRPAAGDTTPEQRFFLAYARSRVSKSRPEYLRQSLASDAHAPSQFRVNGPLANYPSFAETFACQAGNAMVRPESVRVRIW